MSDLLVTLRKIPELAALTPADLDALAAALAVEEYPDGHTFIRQGERGTTIYLVLSGEVVVTDDRGNRRAEINRLGPGALFGLLALIDDEPRSASCSAAGPVRAASLPLASFALLFNAHAPIAYAIQAALAGQLTRDFRQLAERILGALRT